MQREFLEDLERVPVSERDFFVHPAEGVGDLEFLLHVVCPQAKRGAVILAVLPSLEEHLRVGMKRSLIIERIGTPEQRHCKVPQ